MLILFVVEKVETRAIILNG